MTKVLNSLFRDRIALVATCLVLSLAIVAIFAPFVAPQSPVKQDFQSRLAGPSAQHFLGADQMGRDILSRIIFGLRTSFLVGLGSVVISGSIGTFAGCFACLQGGIIGNLIMRLADLHLSLPVLILVMILVVMLNPGVVTVMLALGLNAWMVFARMTYSRALSIKEESYVEAANSMGANMRRILFHHVLPNTATALVSLIMLETARYIIAEAALSFLGFGVQPPTISLGLMLASGRDYLSISWWVSTFPGIVIALLALSFNLVGNRLREVFDPLQQRGQTEV